MRVFERLTGHSRRVAPQREIVLESGFAEIAVLEDGRIAMAINDIPTWVSVHDPNGSVEPLHVEVPRCRVTAMAALPGGRLAVADDNEVSARANLNVWHVDRSMEVVASARHPGPGLSGYAEKLVPLPDGRLVSAGGTGHVCIWTVSSDGLHREVSPRRGHEAPVRAIAALSGGRLAVASSDVRIWGTGRSTEFVKVVGDDTEVWQIVELPDGRLVTSTGPRVTIWDLTGESAPVVLPAGGTIRLLPDGRLVCAGRSIAISDLRIGLDPSPVSLDAPEGLTVGFRVLDERRLVAYYWTRRHSGELWIWDITAGPAPIAVYTDPVVPERENDARAMAVLPDGRPVTVAVGPTGTWIRIWPLP